MENTLLDKRVDHIVAAAMADLLQFPVSSPAGGTIPDNLRLFLIKLITAERAGVYLSDQREAIVLLDNLNRGLLAAGWAEDLFRP